MKTTEIMDKINELSTPEMIEYITETLEKNEKIQNQFMVEEFKNLLLYSLQKLRQFSIKKYH